MPNEGAPLLEKTFESAWFMLTKGLMSFTHSSDRNRGAQGRISCASILALLGLLLAVPASPGVLFPSRPSTNHFYVDAGGILNEGARGTIDQVANDLLQQEQVPLLVVTVRSLADQDAADYTIEQYAHELFNRWGIGSQQRNYGMLLLISRDDRKARIELGGGWGRAHDDQAQKVMDKLIVPSFKRGDFALGVTDGVQGLDAMARGLALPAMRIPWWYFAIAAGGLALVIAVIISLFKSGKKGWGWALTAALGLLLFYLIRTALQNRGSGGSAGAFGGGSSGGGGASGSW